VSGIDVTAARGWFRFWFEPTSPIDLGISRVLFFGGVLLAYGWTDFSEWGQVAPEFWMPLPAFSVLGLHAVGPGGLKILQLVWRLALVASAIGWQTRLSMWIAFVLGFYLLGLPHNFGHTFHFDATLVIAMGILACSRAGDACSVDAALDGSTRRPSGEYTWPVRAVWVAMSLVFLAAGIAKLRYGGLAWIYSSNLSIVLNRAAYHVSDADPITGLGLWIAAHGWASRAIAAMTVIVELGFVASLFSRTARLILVPSAAAMLLGIRVLMGPTFGAFLILNVFWVPWSAALEAIAARVKLRPRTTAATTTTSDVSPTL
jgi:hypothetical protein